VEKVAGIVEDVLLPLVPPQAVRTAIRTTACAAIATGAPWTARTVRAFANIR